MTKAVGVFGFTGYAGAVLVSLLSAHPSLSAVSLDKAAVLADLDSLAAIVLATPPEASLSLVEKLISAGKPIVDMSGVLRLSADLTAQYYGSHLVNNYAQRARYGLQPWQGVLDAQLVANPGCYATGALMSLLPLCQAGFILSDPIIVDAKSGTSGAGKHAGSGLLFTQMAQNCFAYKIGCHQHVPEIQQAIHRYTGMACQITLTTQVIPVVSGIYMTIYATLQHAGLSTSDVVACLMESYSDYPLVTVHGLYQGDASADAQYLNLSVTRDTPSVSIAVHVQGRQLQLITSLDNLYKGAASSVIENLNSLFGWPVTTGLISGAGV